MTMKRTLILFLTAMFAFCACVPNENILTVTPSVLDFDGAAGTKTLTVTSTGTWALTMPSGASWLSSSKTYANSSMTIEISVTENTPEARTAELTFNSSGCPAVKVTVNQAAGTAEKPVGGTEPGE